MGASTVLDDMAHWFFMGALLGAMGCSYGAPEPVRFTGHDLSPSLMSAPSLDVSRLAKTDDCADCHADVASHWRQSAHANASKKRVAFAPAATTPFSCCLETSTEG